MTTDTFFHIYQDKRGKWRWTLKHTNGNILADSGQGYSRKASAKRAIDRMTDAAMFAVRPE